MDFKSLITKISSLNDEVKTVAAPELPKAVQLNEDAELRVLAGTSSYISEAKKAKEEKKEEEEVEEAFDADSKPGDTFKTKTGTATKTKTGVVHKRDQYDYDPGSDDVDDKKRKEKARKEKKDESINTEAFKAKFTKMVEAKKEKKMNEAVASVESRIRDAFGAIYDMGDDGLEYLNQHAPIYNRLFDKHDGDLDRIIASEKPAVLKKLANELEDIADGASFDLEESKKAKPDFLDVDKDGDKKEPMKKAVADKKKGAVAKKNESKMMPKGKKRPVKESVEQKLTFKQMVQLVQESGGQQQIDPIDTELFNWATRVATNKLGEGVQAELYAGLIYERNGGIFQMYDVLSESKKK